jgi:hypothetical protein
MPKTGGRQKGTLNKKTVERLAAELLLPPVKVKTGGRKKGTPNKATAERKALVAVHVIAALGGMTQVEADAMTSRQVMRLIMATGLMAGDLKMAGAAATELMPYENAKLAPATPLPPVEDLATTALALHRLLAEMDSTVGADIPVDPAPAA